MKGLLLNDYYNIRNLKWMVLLYLVFPLIALIFCILFMTDDPDFCERFCMILLEAGLVVNLVFVFGILVLLMKNDETAGWAKQVFSLPLNRKDYMKEKYIFIMLVAGSFTVFAAIVSMIVLFATGILSIKNVCIILATAAAVLFFTFIFSSLLISVTIGFGLQKSSMVIYAVSIPWFLSTLADKITSRFFGRLINISAVAVIIICSVVLFIKGWKWVVKKEV